MTRGLFVTGMLRSGTSLVQTLLTNHPDVFAAYQPFHQLHVDVKQAFLDERGIDRALPLGDGLNQAPGEARDFRGWLAGHRFDEETAQELADRATTGKGGSAQDLTGRLHAPAGTFFDIRDSLHAQLAEHYGAADRELRGSKEVLCEEYLPAYLDAGLSCVTVVRDPRAVVASANSGRYLDLVGDKYPLLMLVRLWRKSAAYAVGLRDRAGAHLVRYEDVAHDPAGTLDALAEGLQLTPFPAAVLEGQLRDHTGRPWGGNSSFGDKAGVDAASADAWREVLPEEEALFVEACTLPELQALGYPTTLTASDRAAVIESYAEDETMVRAAYLVDYRLDPARRRYERDRHSIMSVES